jgi:hypothetical protein
LSGICYVTHNLADQAIFNDGNADIARIFMFGFLFALGKSDEEVTKMRAWAAEAERRKKREQRQAKNLVGKRQPDGRNPGKSNSAWDDIDTDTDAGNGYFSRDNVAVSPLWSGMASDATSDSSAFDSGSSDSGGSFSSD